MLLIIKKAEREIYIYLSPKVLKVRAKGWQQRPNTLKECHRHVELLTKYNIIIVLF